MFLEYSQCIELVYPKKLLDYQLITSSCCKNKINAAVGGVGLLLSSKARNNLMNIETITPRIMIAEFDSNPVLICYSPHNSSAEDDVDNFYNELRSLCSNIPAHNLLLISGDLNARLGSADAQFSYHTKTNRNGEKLIDFMTEFNLSAVNTQFMNNQNKLWTYQHPTGTKAQLDYILIRKKWVNSVRNCRAYSSFSSVLSDHIIVSAHISLSLCTKSSSWSVWTGR